MKIVRTGRSLPRRSASSPALDEQLSIADLFGIGVGSTRLDFHRKAKRSPDRTSIPFILNAAREHRASSRRARGPGNGEYRFPSPPSGRTAAHAASSQTAAMAHITAVTRRYNRGHFKPRPVVGGITATSNSVARASIRSGL